MLGYFKFSVEKANVVGHNTTHCAAPWCSLSVSVCTYYIVIESIE